MNAKEAKELASKSRLRGLDEIYPLIRKAASSGKTCLYMYESISHDVKEELEKNGYKVTSSSTKFDRNEILVTIRWEE